MRPHIPSAEPQTASEIGRWFISCPLWWQWCVPWFLAPVQLQGKRNVVFKTD